jgi:hypothetical protein
MYYRRKMDTIRSAALNNRSLIMNVLYIVIFLIAVYYGYKYFTEAGDDAYLSGDPLVAGSNTNTAQTVYAIADDKDRKKFRIREGGDFAFSTWIYINSYSSHNFGLPKPVFTISDASVASNYLLAGILYPNENKMMIRAYTGTTSSVSDSTITIDSIGAGAVTPAGAGAVTPAGMRNEGPPTGPPGSAGALAGASAVDMTSKSVFSNMTSGHFTSDNSICDIQNIDLQRWINITVAVSGRIMDVYMDGKLTRSCILPNPIRASDTGAQAIQMVPRSGFGGFFSRLRFFNYAPTPDTIYANYQAGPYKGKGFLEYLGTIIGVKFQYTDASGATRTTGSTA